MEYVNSQEAEREELVHAIALALLTRKKLFVLGDTGQSKSHAVTLFCQQTEDAKMFLTVMSKQTDQEQLFGRLDLSSLIPGNVSQRTLDRDLGYAQLKEQLKGQLACCRQNPNDLTALKAAVQTQQKMEVLRKCLSEWHGGRPEYITTGKIPEAHICFLDELFKANEGILNSLLLALNERQYVNEGVVLSIPVVSFFSASNEIPNFNNPEERILKPLYDRFDLKVHTHYVQSKAKRMEILQRKQDISPQESFDATITMQELVFM
ncbi:AAA family ATPase [Solibaculum mannosilyticum]|uniref:AAA family ATPase n=1 Tax=Solibaculum mannosilyticum TaxID=2780922 RepID=UPI0036F44727